MSYVRMGVVLACVAYSVLLHMFILNGEADGVRLLLVLLPLLLWACWAAARAVSPKWWPLLAAAFAGLVYGLLAQHQMRVGLIAVNGMWHASMNLFMLWLFARTLRQGRVPLITQVARHLDGGVAPPGMDAYTRNVTIAWSLFFAAQLLVSATLYLFAPLPVWSLFINVLNAPLLALMFGGEYMVRVLRYPGYARNSILQVIEVFTRNFAAPPRKD